MIPRKFHRRLHKISPKNLSSVVFKIFLTKKLLSLPLKFCQEFERIFFAILSNLRKTRSLLEHKAARQCRAIMTRARTLSLRRPLQLFRLFARLVDRADVVERGFGQIVDRAVDDRT